MDRQSEPAGAGRDPDGRLRKALEVIVRAYRGEVPETLCRDAAECFESLLDMSVGGDPVRHFASECGVDPRYLTDGANFIISMMHFNQENNYYVTLGISEKASQDEVRERWKKLMLLYHPDRRAGNEGLFAGRAKKVNEAYNSLKYAPARKAFDRKLAQDRFRRLSRRAAAGASVAVLRPAAARRPLGRGPFSRDGRNFGKYLPEVVVACYIAAAAVFILSISYRSRWTFLESQLRPAGEAAVLRSLPVSGTDDDVNGPAVAYITRADVEDLLKRYADSIREGSLKGVLGLFSKKAVGRGGEGYEIIRDFYRKILSSKITSYRLDNVGIEIEGRTARVRGAYTVGYGLPGGLVQIRSGRISWTLARDGDTLKIVESDDDN